MLKGFVVVSNPTQYWVLTKLINDVQKLFDYNYLTHDSPVYFFVIVEPHRKLNKLKFVSGAEIVHLLPRQKKWPPVETERLSIACHMKIFTALCWRIIFFL